LDVHVVHGGATIVSRLVTRVCHHRCANDMEATGQKQAYGYRPKQSEQE
jgi:hypothetical protein